MGIGWIRKFSRLAACFFLLFLGRVPGKAFGAEKLTGIQSARALSLSMASIAQEAGLFRKYNLDFQLVYIPSSPLVTAALLAGDATAEATKILLTDREFSYRVLAKELRINDRKVLDASYNPEIKVLEPRLDINPESLQAILDEVSQIDLRAKRVKPQEFVDRRYLDEMEKSGFFDQLWGGKR
jgi:hypothetical protein